VSNAKVAGIAHEDIVLYVIGAADEPTIAEIEERMGENEELAECIRLLRYAMDGTAEVLPTDQPGSGEWEEAWAPVGEFWSQAAREATNRAEQRLTNQVAELRERFEATSAWLFVLEPDELLRARITQRTHKRHLELRLDGAGVVPHVARTKRGYCARLVSIDSRYRKEIDETRSELAVPILTHDRDLLGVLNLESNLEGSFSPAQIDTLQAAAISLVPHLLVLAGLERCPWHPEEHGWDLTELFTRFCHSIAAFLDLDSQDDMTTCSIWYADRPKNELFIYATGGYDVEYIADKTLPMRSFMGRVSASPRGTIWDSAPRDAPDFRELVKADQTGLTRIIAAPIYSPGTSSDCGGVAVINVYFFDKSNQSIRAVTREIGAVADALGAIIAAYRTQRQRLVDAHLYQRLLVRPQSSDSAFETIKEVLKEVFDAEGCSIFARHPETRKLYLATTTGIEASSVRDSAEASGGLAEARNHQSGYYDMDHDHGYTTYLANHCGVCARKNDVMSTSEQGLPRDFPSRPLNKFREKFARSEMDHRRFMGIGIGLRDEVSADREDVLGVFRLNRSSDSRPFTRCDQELLEHIAHQEPCKLAFLDWRAKQPRSRSTLTSAREASIVAAVAKFMRPIPALVSPPVMIGELLQTLVVIFGEHRIRQAGIVVHHRYAKKAPYRWYAYHSIYSKTPPGDGEFPIAERPDRGRHLASLFEHHKIVTFQYDRSIPNSTGVACEMWVPLITWHGQNHVEGILALEFEESVKWGIHELEVIFDAARKLSAILASTDQVIRPECFLMDPVTALGRLLMFPLEQKAIAAEWAELYLKYDNIAQLVGRRHSAESLRARKPHKMLERAEAQSPSDRNLTSSAPLYLGPYAIGEIRCNLKPGGDDHRKNELFRIVPCLWSRLTFGMKKFWEIEFTPTRLDDGVTRWDERLSPHRIELLDQTALTGIEQTSLTMNFKRHQDKFVLNNLQ
jgi:putative methionine-R-sulfoxide reductase with GAF domain